MEVVKIDDLNEIFYGDEFKKDDEIYQYAVCLLEWAINKRKFTIADDTPIIS